MNPELSPPPADPAAARPVSHGRVRPPLRAWLPNVAVALVAGFLAWRSWRVTGAWPIAPTAIATFAGLLLLLAFAAPRAHAPIQRALETLGRRIAQGVTWLVLALLFAGVFVPGRLVIALFRGDPLGRRPAKSPAETFWRKLPAAAGTDAAGRFRRQF